jgi:hypothetical protein
MAELFIESFPSIAQVQIDGVIVGTTPMTYTIDELIGLAEFRAECLSGGNIVCSWDAIKTRLEDQTVSRLWWDLTRDERYSISIIAIMNTMWNLSAIKRLGAQDCEGGIGDTGFTYCLDNAIIRYLKFVSSNFTKIDSYYWRYGGTSEETEKCWRPDICYNLPGHVISCMPLPDAQNHAMCGIQIDSNMDSIDSWVVFNYMDCDIKPGDTQMKDPYIRAWVPEHDSIDVSLVGMSIPSLNIIAEFVV